MSCIQYFKHHCHSAQTLEECGRNRGGRRKKRRGRDDTKNANFLFLLCCCWLGCSVDCARTLRAPAAGGGEPVFYHNTLLAGWPYLFLFWQGPWCSVLGRARASGTRAESSSRQSEPIRICVENQKHNKDCQPERKWQPDSVPKVLTPNAPSAQSQCTRWKSFCLME